MKKKLALVMALALTMGIAATACGKKSSGTAGAGSADNKVYAVEAGSAGQAVAKDNGWKTNVVAAQSDALMEVASGTSDAAIIDLLMAGAMIGEGTSYPDLKYTDKLTTEEYGVGCRKGSDLVSYINSVFASSYDNNHHTFFLEYAVTSAGFKFPFFVGCHCFASSGFTVCKSLYPFNILCPDLKGFPLPSTLL